MEQPVLFTGLFSFCIFTDKYKVFSSVKIYRIRKIRKASISSKEILSPLARFYLFIKQAQKLKIPPMKSSSYFITGIFLIIILLAGCASCGNSSKSEQLKSDIPERPNVVFIICDDLNDYSGAFSGHTQVRTPNIDKLAKEGVQFTNAFMPAPVCSPTRSALITGTMQTTLGTHNHRSSRDETALIHLPDNVKTVP